MSRAAAARRENTINVGCGKATPPPPSVKDDWLSFDIARDFFPASLFPIHNSPLPYIFRLFSVSAVNNLSASVVGGGGEGLKKGGGGGGGEIVLAQVALGVGFDDIWHTKVKKIGSEDHFRNQVKVEIRIEIIGKKNNLAEI